MKSTEYRPTLRMSADFEARFEKLRANYYARLAGDRSRLMKLRVDFDHSAGPEALYDQIQRVAHGMAGAAAVFEAGQVARLARTLERAARAACKAPGAASHAAVQSALDAMVDLLLTISA
jgi:HPt (histidine-containing phosphotransfer) domain-containing protein